MCKYCEGEYPEDLLNINVGEVFGEDFSIQVGIVTSTKEIQTSADIGGTSLCGTYDKKKIKYCPMCGRKL